MLALITNREVPRICMQYSCVKSNKYSDDQSSLCHSSSKSPSHVNAHGDGVSPINIYKYILKNTGTLAGLPSWMLY